MDNVMNNNGKSVVKLQSFDKGFIIKVPYRLSQEDIKKLYDNLYKQLQRGLVVLDRDLEFIETYQIDYEECKIC